LHREYDVQRANRDRSHHQCVIIGCAQRHGLEGLIDDVKQLAGGITLRTPTPLEVIDELLRYRDRFSKLDYSTRAEAFGVKI